MAKGTGEEVASCQFSVSSEYRKRINQQSATGNRKKASFKEKREFELLEKEIADLEAEKQQIEEELSNPDAPFDKLNLLSRRMGEISNLLNDKEMRWFELSEII